jgi:hypothetical protein
MNGRSPSREADANACSYFARQFARRCTRAFAKDAALNEWKAETFYRGGAEGYVDYPRLADS